MLSESKLTKIYQELHQIPELALEEVKTKAYLQQAIAKLDQSYLEIKEIPELPTALLVKVQGSDPKRTIGYRCDIDALPLTEETGLEFSSKNPGVMHACGHDIHMTVALGVLAYFTTTRPKDDLIFFFQPAEESKNGGKLAYELGVFSGKWRPDEFYALHDAPELPTGAIGCNLGTLFAGTTEVDIHLYGKGGHAAYPHQANDMIVCASALIMQAQTIISRNVDPTKGGVLTFGELKAGTIRNVIAGEAMIKGTIRGLTQEMITLIQKRLQEICDGIAQSFGARVELTLNQGGYLPVENDPVLTAFFIEHMQKAPDVEFIETEPKMTGEDFGYLLSKFPGTMFWLGVNDVHALHSNKLVPDQTAILKGVNAITGFLCARMKQEKEVDA